jgi:hypothetical protein
MAERDVLLMGSAIKTPTAFQAITNADERLLQTLCGLTRWIRDTSVETIVLCDGTNPDYDFSRIQAFATEHGKTLEVLLFEKRDDQYATRGKSYGEGQVLEHAVTHSSHLRPGGNFYKVTGRTFVENFDAIKAAHAEDDTVFTGPASIMMPKGTPTDVFGPSSVWTQFYKCGVDFFTEHLMRAYLHTDDATNPIECEYFARLQHLPHARFSIKPFIVGRNGGLNLPYDADFDEGTAALARTFI